MNVLLESFSIFSLKLFLLEMLVIDGCSKNSNKIFHKTPMDASGWMRKNIIYGNN